MFCVITEHLAFGVKCSFADCFPTSFCWTILFICTWPSAGNCIKVRNRVLFGFYFVMSLLFLPVWLQDFLLGVWWCWLRIHFTCCWSPACTFLGISLVVARLLPYPSCTTQAKLLQILFWEVSFVLVSLLFLWLFPEKAWLRLEQAVLAPDHAEPAIAPPPPLPQSQVKSVLEGFLLTMEVHLCFCRVLGSLGFWKFWIIYQDPTHVVSVKWF